MRGSVTQDVCPKVTNAGETIKGEMLHGLHMAVPAKTIFLNNQRQIT